MKNYFLLLIFITSTVFTYSQDTIKLNYDYAKKRITTNTNKIKIKNDSAYIIRIIGINSAVMSTKLDPMMYSLSSTTPEILKALYPGISSSDQVLKGFSPDKIADTYKNIYEQVSHKMDNFLEIKSISDKLYKNTKNKPNPGLSKTAFTNACNLYNIDPEDQDELIARIIVDMNYIKHVTALFDYRIKELYKHDVIDEKLIEYHSTLKYALDEIIGENYLHYANFIIKSQTSKESFDSDAFIAKKDLIDLDALLVNTYNKDTVYKATLPFYTYGKWTFDFSSGFFYNNVVEKMYYLQPRDDLINVIEEKTIDFDVSFGALGHFSYKFSNYTRAGVSMGAAISPLDAKVRYLLGLSCLLGRKNQVGFNVGLVMAKINVLSGAVKEDDIGKYVPAATKEVPTYSKLENGFFFGITYNITSKKK